MPASERPDFIGVVASIGVIRSDEVLDANGVSTRIDPIAAIERHEAPSLFASGHDATGRRGHPVISTTRLLSRPFRIGRGILPFDFPLLRTYLILLPCPKAPQGQKRPADAIRQRRSHHANDDGGDGGREGSSRQGVSAVAPIAAFALGAYDKQTGGRLQMNYFECLSGP